MEDKSDDKLKNFKFLKLSENHKKLYLDLLGYSIDTEGFIVEKGNAKKRVECIYTHKPVKFRDASLLPGSTKIINTSAYTLSAYISDFLAGEAQND